MRVKSQRAQSQGRKEKVYRSKDRALESKRGQSADLPTFCQGWVWNVTYLYEQPYLGNQTF